MPEGLAELYARAHVPVAFEVAGTALEPFTLGHAISLEVLGQADLADDDLAGLLLALEVCRRPPGAFLRGTPRLAFRLGLRVRAFWLGVRYGPLRLLREIPKFRAYCRHWGQMPSFRNDPAQGESTAGAPFLEHLLVCLMARLGYSESAALALPLGTALLRYTIHWETEGRLELATDAQDELAAALTADAAQRHAEILAAANARLAASA
jgi:hypothetical protein